MPTTETLNRRMKQRQNTAAGWTASNSVLYNGEFGYETDTKKLKIGDGTLAWADLPYLPTTGGAGGGAWGSITGTLGTQTDLQTALNAKQATLVSSTNIKTVNGFSLVGSGDVPVPGTTDATITTSDITTNNVSTAKHGWTPKLPNDATKYLNGVGAYAVPAGGGGGAVESLNTTYGNDLAAAITAIGATPKTLLVNVDATVSTAQVIPTTLQLEFRNGAKFVKSATGAITFSGVGIIADPQHQLFSGFAVEQIKWTGAYPVFRPEWFGAVGDNATDCLAAFNLTLAAIQNRFGDAGFAIGARVKLTEGKRYYFSGTLHVRRTVLIDGGPYGLNTPTVHFRFPANTTGVIFHGSSTFDGVTSNFTSLGSEIRGVGIFGAKGVTNTLLSTNGLSFTLTGGTYPIVNPVGNTSGSIPATPNGTTITVNGYTYIMDTPVSGNTDLTVFTIQKPRLMIAGVGDGTFYVIGQNFPSNNDWAGMTMTTKNEQGGTLGVYTITSHTTTVITLGSALTNAVYEVEISGVKVMTAQTGRLNVYHGIDLREQTKISECNINNFAGSGVEMDSQRLPTAASGTEPNQNNSWIERTVSSDNEGHGFHFYGINTNNISTFLIDAGNNRGCGLFESGTAGSNHWGFHTMFNKHGAFNMQGLIAKNMLTNIYTEGQQPSGIPGQHTIIMGGLHGAGFRSGGAALPNAVSVIRALDANNTGHALIRTIGGPVNNNLIEGFGGGDDSGNLASGGTNSVVIHPSYTRKYDNPKAGWYGWVWSNNALTTPTNQVIAMSGGAAAEGGGQLAFPEGFRTGSYPGGPWSPDAKISRMLPGTVAIDPASIAANSVVTEAFTLTGAVVGDAIVLNPPAAGLTAGLLVLQVRVSAANTVSITFHNTTGAAIDQASGTWNYLIVRS